MASGKEGLSRRQFLTLSAGAALILGGSVDGVGFTSRQNSRAVRISRRRFPVDQNAQNEADQAISQHRQALDEAYRKGDSEEVVKLTTGEGASEYRQALGIIDAQRNQQSRQSNEYKRLVPPSWRSLIDVGSLLGGVVLVMKGADRGGESLSSETDQIPAPADGK